MHIKNEAQKKNALAVVEIIFNDARFEPGTPNAKRLSEMIDAIERFEEYHYPIGKRTKLKSFIAWLKWMLG
jgi:antitoxin component HigA of HigAB toxin-antitoxin module